MAPTTAVTTQRRRVEIGWRFASLCRAGFAERDALELAMRPDVDLHVALKLIREGCEHETALRILR